MKKIIGSVMAVVLMAAAASADARRNYETEYYLYVDGGFVGSVLYPCEGGQVFFWDDMVPRTRAESLALLDQSVREAAAHPVTIDGSQLKCVAPLTQKYCLNEFDWAEPWTTWEDAIAACSWID